MNKKNINIYFRVDGYKEIGYGHLMRSIVLAKEFKKKYNIRFISYRDDFLKFKLKENKINYILLRNKAGSKRDVKETIDIISKGVENIFVHDNYDINAAYEKMIKSYVKLLIAVDDEAKKKFYADIIINQNYGAENYKYKLLNKDAGVLAGSKYILLRDEFLKKQKSGVNKEVKNILIIFGGSDFFNQSLRTLKVLKKYVIKNNINLNLVLNNNFKSLRSIKKESHGIKNIKLYFNVKSMAKLMNKMDMAISAAGSTVWELLYIGIPAILMITAENQKDIAFKLGRDGYVKNLGWYNKVSDNKILNEVKALIDKHSKRLNFFNKGIKLIDGKGKERVLESFANLLKC